MNFVEISTFLGSAAIFERDEIFASDTTCTVCRVSRTFLRQSRSRKEITFCPQRYFFSLSHNGVHLVVSRFLILLSDVGAIALGMLIVVETNLPVVRARPKLRFRSSYLCEDTPSALRSFSSEGFARLLFVNIISLLYKETHFIHSFIQWEIEWCLRFEDEKHLAGTKSSWSPLNNLPKRNIEG